MAEFASAHSELVDAHNEIDDKLELLKSKMADLEDRSHRNNVKLRGVADSVPPYAGITIYADLSQHTMMAWKKLVPLTKLLHNNQLPYSWGFPTKLLITKNGSTYAVKSLKEGLQLTK